MKFHSKTRYLVSAVVLLGAVAMLALPHQSRFTEATTPDSEDTLHTDEPVHNWLPGELRDTLAHQNEVLATQRRSYNAQIKLLTRTYGDSIVLRWAPEDYVTWKFLCNKGVDIIRLTEDGDRVVKDTIAKAFRPASLEEFHAAYTETDSLAILAMGSLYGLNFPTESITHGETGSTGSLYELQQEQQTLLGVAILASELRRDLADRLAMRFVDKKVKRSKTYIYRIEPSDSDDSGKLVIDPCNSPELVNEPYKPEPYDIRVTDTVLPPRGIMLYWERRNFSCYELERRPKGATQWKRLTQQPYMIMLPEQDSHDCFFGDHPGTPGYYEYRIFAHDPFGDLTEPSPVHTAYFPDMVPPQPPVLQRIVIDRPNENDPSAEVWANIYVRKDTMEADFKGMIPMYYHEVKTNGQWKSLLEPDQMMAPTDTVVRIDVTNLASGQLVVAAVDTAGNMAYSMPQLLRVSDMRPPKAPTGFKATPSVQDGTITLTWNPIEDDDIDYYELVYANDSTHTFLTRNTGALRDTIYVDTIAMDANQKYIYYKVRAVDCATNVGEFTPMLQVVRPSNVPPTVAHIDSTHVSDKGIFMRWITADEQQTSHHHVYRKLDTDKEWTLLRRCDGDSVRAAGNRIDILDKPQYNAKNEYIYAVESFNYSGISSGLSLQYMVRYTGDNAFNVPIKLYGDYDQARRLTTLAWESSQLPEGDDWYFCIWRKGPDDDRFQFFISAEPTERSFTDRLLRPGQEAHYFIQIQMRDGRESKPSNAVTVKAPEKK